MRIPAQGSSQPVRTEAMMRHHGARDEDENCTIVVDSNHSGSDGRDRSRSSSQDSVVDLQVLILATRKAEFSQTLVTMNLPECNPSVCNIPGDSLSKVPCRNDFWCYPPLSGITSRKCLQKAVAYLQWYQRVWFLKTAASFLQSFPNHSR